MSDRFRPVANRDTQFFWDATRAHCLRVQRCSDCALIRHPPGPMCPRCQSLSFDLMASSGRGAIYSFVVVHKPVQPGFTYPHAVALCEMDEGWRFVADIDADPADLRIGARVSVEFVDIDSELTLPRFRLAEDKD